MPVTPPVKARLLAEPWEAIKSGAPAIGTSDALQALKLFGRLAISVRLLGAEASRSAAASCRAARGHRHALLSSPHCRSCDRAQRFASGPTGLAAALSALFVRYHGQQLEGMGSRLSARQQVITGHHRPAILRSSSLH